MTTHFVLIDFENVPSARLATLRGRPLKIKVFAGANQTKIPLETARILQTFGADAEYIQISGTGHNALDFHIAYYLGRLAVQFPQAQFHIISKDTGFDPLIHHLKAHNVTCHRSASMENAPAIPNLDTAPTKAARVIADLIKRKAAKPRTLRTLTSTIKALFRNELTEDELAAILRELDQRGIVAISAGKVSYALPEDSSP